MADDLTQPAPLDQQGGGLGITFSDAGQLLGGIMSAFEEQAAGNRSILEQTAIETARVRDSAAALQQVTESGLQRAIEVQRRGQEAQRLASGGILEGIELIGAQLLDPANYTRAGRENQLRDIQARSDMAATMHNANVTASSARVAAHEARTKLNMFGAETKMQALATRVSTLGTLVQGVAASEQLRLSGLSQFSQNDVIGMLNDPQLKVDGTVTRNGFKYGRDELLERKKDLDVRQHLAMLSPNVTDPAYANMIRSYHTLLLGTMSYDEMIKIRDSDMRMDDGMQVDADILDAAIARRAGIDQSRVESTINSQMLSQQLPLMLSETKKRMDYYASSIGPDSPLFGAFNQYRIGVATATASLSANGQSPIAMGAALEALQKQEQAWAATVESEAVRQSSGDADLAVILRDQMFGRPVEPRTVTDYITTRYRDSKPFSRVFGADSRINPMEVSKAIDLKLQAKVDAFTTQNLGEKPSSAEMKELRSQAAQEGLAEFWQIKAGEAVNQLPQLGMQRKDNPIVATGLTEAEYYSLGGQAENMAIESLTSRFQLKDNAMAEVLRGNHLTVGISDTQADELKAAYNQEAVMFEYDLLESKKPGLGADYAAWFMANADQLTDMSTSRYGTAENMVLVDAAQATSMAKALWQSADETAKPRGQQIIAENLMGWKQPTVKMRAVLSGIRELTPQQSERLMTKIFDPILKKAEAEGLDAEATTQLLTTALEAGIEGDVETSRAAQRALRSLPASIAMYESMIETLNSEALMRNEARRGTAINMLESMQTGTQPSEQQRIRAGELVTGMAQPGGYYDAMSGYIKPTPGYFLDNPGGPEALLEQLRNQ